MSKKYKVISVLLITILLITNIVTYLKYKEIKQSESATYDQLVNRFYSYGIAIPYDSVHLMNERFDQDDLKVWLNEIVAQMKIATETSSIAAQHWQLTIGDKNQYDSVSEVSHFFRSIDINLNDIIKTEKDYTVWKQACMDLEDILKMVNDNTDEEQLIEADYSEIKTDWKKIMELVREKHSDSRLLKSYFEVR